MLLQSMQEMLANASFLWRMLVQCVKSHWNIMSNVVLAPVFCSGVYYRCVNAHAGSVGERLLSLANACAMCEVTLKNHVECGACAIVP